MNATKTELLTLFEGKQAGFVLSRAEVEDALGVSRRSVDRLVADAEALERAGIRVLTVTSFIKTGEPIGSALKSGVDCANPEEADGVDCANKSERGHSTKEPPAAPLTPHDKVPAPAAPLDFALPDGYRVTDHKYLGRVVLDPRGRIDGPCTDRLKKAEAGVDPWLSTAADGTKPEAEVPLGAEDF